MTNIAPTMRLFSRGARTDSRYRARTEGVYKFTDRVDQPLWQSVRDMCESWFEDFPNKTPQDFQARKDLASRFQSKDAGDHYGAWWELYLHRTFTDLGYDVDIHPEIKGHRRRPDFRVHDRETEFLLEAATVSSGVVDEDRDETKEAWILDAIEKINEKGFSLDVEITRVGSERPKVHEITRPIESWLSTLDPDQHPLGAGIGPERFDVRGWQFELEVYGSRTDFRDVESSVIALGPSSGGPVDDREQLLQTLKKKRSKFGQSTTPAVIAVLPTSTFMTDRDFHSALFGGEAIRYFRGPGPSPEPHWFRQRNGFWAGPDGPTCQRISAVISGIGLHPTTIANVGLTIWMNPWARNPLKANVPFRHAITQSSSEHRFEAATRSPQEILQIPADWPFTVDQHG